MLAFGNKKRVEAKFPNRQEQLSQRISGTSRTGTWRQAELYHLCFFLPVGFILTLQTTSLQLVRHMEINSSQESTFKSSVPNGDLFWLSGCQNPKSQRKDSLAKLESSVQLTVIKDVSHRIRTSQLICYQYSWVGSMNRQYKRSILGSNIIVVHCDFWTLLIPESIQTCL